MLSPGEIISILHHLGDYFAIPSHFDLVSRETDLLHKVIIVLIAFEFIFACECHVALVMWLEEQNSCTSDFLKTTDHMSNPSAVPL